MQRKLLTALIETLAVVIGCAVSGGTVAQSGDEGAAPMPLAGQTLPAETLRESRFRFLDLNGDDFITRDEVEENDSVLRSQFTSLDWNDDGKLSEGEYVLNGRPK